MNKHIEPSEAIEQSEDLQKGRARFDEMDEYANTMADKLASDIIQKMIAENNGEQFNLSTAILAAAKTLSHLASFMYETEDEFLKDVQMAREAAVSSVIPALLDPHPCGLCEDCKNGHPEQCINPVVRAERTTSRFLPILCNMVLEYDLFNKVLWMHTVGKDDFPTPDRR